jgi:hypothetical protein
MREYKLKILRLEQEVYSLEVRLWNEERANEKLRESIQNLHDALNAERRKNLSVLASPLTERVSPQGTELGEIRLPVRGEVKLDRHMIQVSFDTDKGTIRCQYCANHLPRVKNALFALDDLLGIVYREFEYFINKESSRGEEE